MVPKRVFGLIARRMRGSIHITTLLQFFLLIGEVHSALEVAKKSIYGLKRRAIFPSEPQRFGGISQNNARAGMKRNLVALSARKLWRSTKQSGSSANDSIGCDECFRVATPSIRARIILMKVSTRSFARFLRNVQRVKMFSRSAARLIDC